MAIRLPAREDMNARPPQYLLDEIERLLAVETTSLTRLEQYVRSLECPIPCEILRLFSQDDILQGSAVVEHSLAYSERAHDSSPPSAAVASPSKRMHSKTSATPSPKKSSRPATCPPEISAALPAMLNTDVGKRDAPLVAASTDTPRKRMRGKRPDPLSPGTPAVVSSSPGTTSKILPGGLLDLKTLPGTGAHGTTQNHALGPTATPSAQSTLVNAPDSTAVPPQAHGLVFSPSTSNVSPGLLGAGCGMEEQGGPAAPTHTPSPDVIDLSPPENSENAAPPASRISFF